MNLKKIAFWAGLLTLLAFILMGTSLTPFGGLVKFIISTIGSIIMGLMILFWTGVFPWLLYKNMQGDKKLLWQIIASLSTLLSLLIIAFYIFLIDFGMHFEG